VSDIRERVGVSEEKSRRSRTAARPWRPLVVLAGLCLAGSAWSQAYPTKPVRIVVAFSPGGATDVISRIVGGKLAERWGQQVLIDNRPGAGGSIGAEHVARSAPDGHTLIMGSLSEIAINPALNPKLAYDPARDFAPVVLVASVPLALCVHPSIPVRSVKDYVALARAKPQSINYASSGAGTTTHLGMELLRTAAGIELVHVPYKGGPPGAADVVAGQVQAILGTVSTVLPFSRAGRMRCVAVTSTRRSGSFPEVPTVAESGYPGYEVVLWSGLLAAAGTSADIVARVHGETAKILALPDVREGLARQGADIDLKSPAEFAAYLTTELAKWSKVVKASGVKLE
jgi:tripartite-type tricarboxylate transporter receptor subunit TctC